MLKLLPPTIFGSGTIHQKKFRNFATHSFEMNTLFYNLFSDRTEYYTTAKNLLVSGADAMERLMTAYKEIVELAGYTARVAVMIQVFEDCSDSKYQRQAVAGAPSKGVTNETQFSIEFQDGMPVSKGVVTESTDGTIHLENVGNMNFL